MSRFNLSIALGLGSVLVSIASPTWAQTDPNSPMSRLETAGVRESTMLDVASVPTANDPAAVEMLFAEGNTIASILEGLKEKGFSIEYREKHFLPEMTLQSLPTSSRIDDVLREILEPWNFRVYRSPMGKWVVTPNKKKMSAAPNDETHEKLKNIIKTREGE